MTNVYIKENVRKEIRKTINKTRKADSTYRWNYS